MAPRAATTLNPVDLRLSGGMLALNRLVMTLQNKRMPVANISIGRDAAGMRATILLDCPPETARRYATLLSGLEDVEGIEVPEETVEVALVKVETPRRETPHRGVSTDWRGSAAREGVEAHEANGTIVASGEPERVEAWLASLGEEVEDMVRLGPVARPGDGG